LAHVKRSIVSVSEKNGLVDFCRELERLGVEIVSTGGTAKVLKDAGISVLDVAEVTGFPEMMSGRVKTMHPFIPTSHTVVHTGDNITQHVTASEKSQVVAKGDENKNINVPLPLNGDAAKKSLIDQINAPATFAAFLGFVISEIGTHFYPITYNHLISVCVAVIVFVLVALFNKR